VAGQEAMDELLMSNSDELRCQGARVVVDVLFNFLEFPIYDAPFDSGASALVRGAGAMLVDFIQQICAYGESFFDIHCRSHPSCTAPKCPPSQLT